jgi:hypothetical protein
MSGLVKEELIKISDEVILPAVEKALASVGEELFQRLCAFIKAELDSRAPTSSVPNTLLP